MQCRRVTLRRTSEPLADYLRDTKQSLEGLPPRPGRYRVDLVLADDKGQPVDERSSSGVTLDRIPSLQ